MTCIQAAAAATHTLWVHSLEIRRRAEKNLSILTLRRLILSIFRNLLQCQRCPFRRSTAWLWTHGLRHAYSVYKAQSFNFSSTRIFLNFFRYFYCAMWLNCVFIITKLQITIWLVECIWAGNGVCVLFPPRIHKIGGNKAFYISFFEWCGRCS